MSTLSTFLDILDTEIPSSIATVPLLPQITTAVSTVSTLLNFLEPEIPSSSATVPHSPQITAAVSTVSTWIHFLEPEIPRRIAAVPLSKDTSSTDEFIELSDSPFKVKSPSPEMDDVTYLYTVESETVKLIEVLDISDDNKGIAEISKNRDLVLSTRNHEKSHCGLPEIIISPPRVTQRQEKSNDQIQLSVQTVGRRNRKRGEVRPVHCRVCQEDYESITKRGNMLFSSKCGHLFCTTCLRFLEPYECIVCNERIWNLNKIHL